MKTIPMFVFAVCLVACGSDEEAPSDKFVDTWVYQSGEGFYACSDGLSGPLTVRVGFEMYFETDADDTVTAVVTDHCAFELDVDDRATARHHAAPRPHAWAPCAPSMRSIITMDRGPQPLLLEKTKNGWLTAII